MTSAPTTIDYFVGQVLYRIEDEVRASLHGPCRPVVRVRTFFVERVTPCGAWICEGSPPEARVPDVLEAAVGGYKKLRGPPRWVMRSTNRSIGLFAAPTLEQALANAIARRTWHLKCLRAEVTRTEERLATLHSYPLESRR